MDECLERILGAGPLILFLDYDGTLAELRPRPQDAVLRAERRRLLSALAGKIPLAFVSGRPLAELAALIAIPQAGLIGNHGLEILWPGRSWVHPRARAAAPEVAGFLRSMRAGTRRMAGVWVEDKGLSGSIHFRQALSATRRELRRLLAGEIGRRASSLRLLPGKMVWEVRPQADWDKGRAIIRYASRLGAGARRAKVYIGDDRTDEDAFRVLGPRDIGIAVGNRRASAAEFRRRDVAGVWRLLGRLCARQR